MTTYRLPAETLPATERLKIQQTINRKWMYALDAIEFKIVSIIYDRTVAWGKPLEKIAYREFVKGRGTAFCGTGLSRSSVMRAIKRLLYRGTLVRTGDGQSAAHYGLNLDWDPNSDEETDPLPPNKRDNVTKSGVSVTRGRCQDDTTTSVSVTPLIKEPSKKNSLYLDRASLPHSRRETSETSEGRDKGLAEAISEVTSKAEARNKRERNVALEDLNINVRQKQWEAQFRENWPDAPALAWSPKTRGLYHAAVKNGAFNGIVIGEFFEWVIEEWGLIKAIPLSWMSNCPASPRPDVVMTQLYKLLSSFADRVTLRNDFNVDGEVVSRLRQRRRGYSVDQADDRIKKAHAIVAARETHDEQMARERRALAQQRALFEREKSAALAKLDILGRRKSAVAKPISKNCMSGLAPLPVVNLDEEEEQRHKLQ